MAFRVSKGRLLDDWQEKSLRNVCSVFDDGDWIESKDQSDSGFRIIQTGNIGKGEYKDKGDRSRYISLEKFDELKCTEVFEGDLLISRLPEPAGRSALLPILGTRCVTAVDCTIVRPNTKLTTSKYLLYFTNTNRYFTNIENNLSGSTRKRISRGNLERIKIQLPPLLEQKRIVKVLESWDRAIEALRRKIELKKEIKKGLMQELLTGKTRLPGFSGEWEIKIFGELFSNRDERGTEDLPLLSITSKRGVIHQSNSNKKDTSNSDKSRYLRICPGDIGYNTMRMWQGRSALSTIEGLVSPAYTILSPKNSVESRYFSYLFKIPRVVYLFFQKSQGLVSDTWQCRYRDFSIVKYPIPEYKEQKAIADFLNAADKEISALEKKLSLLEDQKKYLLNNLITGAIRTPEKL